MSLFCVKTLNEKLDDSL